jgi:peptidoglycan/LPS O-acetylase OafA/YrhL
LRSLAVLSVVVFHAEANLGVFARPGGGFVGVAVFFVLSGCLMTPLVWRSGDGVGVSGYLAFLRRRLTRLAGGGALALRHIRCAEAVGAGKPDATQPWCFSGWRCGWHLPLCLETRG